MPRYFGRPVRPDGQPHPPADPDILAAVWYDGARMRHWLDGNSVKFYNEHNALRFETTLNNPAPFKVWRCKEGSPDNAKERLPLRKSVADIPLRAKVCDEINKALQKKLAGTVWAKGMTGKRLSARISRNIRLLRDHDLIRKVPEQRKYFLSEKGRRLTAVIPAILSASTEQLTQHAA